MQTYYTIERWGNLLLVGTVTGLKDIINTTQISHTSTSELKGGISIIVHKNSTNEPFGRFLNLNKAKAAEILTIIAEAFPG